jgi:hypothetical protein
MKLSEIIEECEFHPKPKKFIAFIKQLSKKGKTFNPYGVIVHRGKTQILYTKYYIIDMNKIDINDYFIKEIIEDIINGERGPETKKV